MLKLMGATDAGEMLPSLLAQHLAPCLGTDPGAADQRSARRRPSEGLSYAGAAAADHPAAGAQGHADQSGRAAGATCRRCAIRR